MRSPLLRIFSRCIHAGGRTGSVKFAQIPLEAAAPKVSKKRSVLWWGGIGLGVGGIIGVAAGYDQIRRTKTIVPNSEEQAPIILTEVPNVPISRSVRFPNDVSDLKLTLFQYQTCPFCCKVRAILDFFGISYNVVEVNPVMRDQTKWSKYKKVPILVVETPQGEILQLNDSSMVISALYSYLFNNSENSSGQESLLTIVKYYPVINYNDESGKSQTDIMNKYFLMLDANMGGRSKEAIVDERKWRKWADDVYVHCLSPNIYRTYSEALDSFRYFDKVGEWEKHFSQWERSVIIYVGAIAMWIVGKRLQKRHNLKQDVRLSLYEESDFWTSSIKKKGSKFMGGDSPNLSDLAVYGVLSSIEGCQAFRDLTSHSNSLEKWYLAVKSSMKTT